MEKTIVFLRRFIYCLLGFIDNKILKGRPSIFILCYHSISEDMWRHSVNLKVFDKQLNYLVNKYYPITLEDVALYMEGKKEINKPSFVITIDDGYKDVLETKGLFKTLNIEPAIFVLSNTQNADRKELDTNREFLSKKELWGLQKDGWIIGSHGATHADFQSLNNKEIEEEVINSKKNLEKELGIKIKYFSYPKGKYTKEVLKAVKKAGYDLALTMDDSQINIKTDPYRIPRIGVDGTHSLAEFKTLYSPSVISFRKLIKQVMRVVL